MKAKKQGPSKPMNAPVETAVPGASVASTTADDASDRVGVVTPPDVDPPSDEQRVRDAAYRRFEARGSLHGYDEEDWLAAEREVRPPLGN